MADQKTIGRTFGRAALSYDHHAQLQHAVREDCIDMAANLWGKETVILDAGSGTGAFSRYSREHQPGWRVTQLDLSPGMCTVSRRVNPATVCASADAMPFADATFDGVFSSLMLQWLYDPMPAMREIKRVTKPEGTCIISTLAHGTLEELRQSFATLDSAMHVNYFADPAPLTALIVHGGFRLLACEEETITIHYPDVKTLLRSLKAIGANSLQEKRKSGLMTPRQFEKLEDTYFERFADKKGLPATWQVLYMTLERI